MLQIATLGQLAISLDGKPVTGFVSRKVDALLTYLACERRVHEREDLADLLWAPLPRDRAMANLRMSLSSLQAQLGSYLEITRQTVSLNDQSDVWLDVAEITSVIRENEQHNSNGHPLSQYQLSKLQSAIALYRGNFLEGFYLRDSGPFEDWRVFQQEHLHMQVTTILSKIVESAIAVENYSTAISASQRWISIDPFSEQAHRGLMLGFAHVGQRAAALLEYESYRTLLQEEFDSEPDTETVDLMQRIQANELVPHKRQEVILPSHNLPAQTTAFVGRLQELTSLSKKLNSSDCRLITIVGPGGIGKTRLATVLAHTWLGDFPDGVFIIPLASLRNPDLIISSLVTTLGLKVRGSDQQQILRQQLESKKYLLLFDNFEHLLDGKQILSELLNASLQSKIIVTSREPLKIKGESLVRLEGLSIPQSIPEDPESFDAIRLFVKRALHTQPDFTLHDHLPAVIKLCQLVDGIPLAIEIIAAWLRLLSPSEILEHLEESFELFEGTSRDVPHRQQSLIATFEWSWNLLTNSQQTALRRLSVFQSSFNILSAERIAGASIDVLESLIDKSLIQADAQKRYRMHALIRRAAQLKLEEAGLTSELEEKHFRYFADLAVTAAKELAETDEVKYLDLIQSELDNLRTALSWAANHKLSDEVMAIATSMEPFWRYRGHVSEGREWLNSELRKTVGQPSPARAKALTASAALALDQFDLDEIESLAQEALAMAQQLNSQDIVADAVKVLGLLQWNYGNHEDAITYFEQCLTLAKSIENWSLASKALNNIAIIWKARGEYSYAAQLLRECLAIATERNNLAGVAAYQNNLAGIAYCQCDFTEARLRYEESINVDRMLGRIHGVADGSINLASVLIAEGELDKAEDLCQQALVDARSIGDKLVVAKANLRLGHVEYERASYMIAEEYYKKALEKFREINRASAVLCLSDLGCAMIRQLMKKELGLTLIGASNALREQFKLTIVEPEVPKHESALAYAKTNLTEDQFQECYVEGQHLSLDEAVRLGLNT